VTWRDWLGIPREVWQAVPVLLGFLAFDIFVVYMCR